MQRKVQRFTIVAAASALAVFAADAWKTKDSSQWTSEEVTKVLTDSPWAKDKTVAPEGAGQQQRGRRGGMGGQDGGMGGGGIGFPGGGYPRAGGYPNGGGGGYPRGGGYPPGGGGYPNGGGGGYPGGGGGYPNPSMNLTIRWQSAAPVQEALVRQRSLSAEEAKALADASQKDYIITMVGFRMPNRRSSSRNIDSPDSNDQDRDSDVKAGSKNNDALRSRFLDAARLVPRGKSPIYAEDVQFEGPNGASEIRFMFPRNKEISADDKEVVFAFELEGIKFEHKFRLSDMSYQGKLAL